MNIASDDSVTTDKRYGTGLTIVVADASGQSVLLDGTERACRSLNCRSDISAPRFDVICIDPDPYKIQIAIEGVPPRTMVIAGIEAASGIDAALIMSRTINAAEATLAIAERSVGSPPSVFSAGQLLSLVQHGATAVFREYDFIAEDTVLLLLIEYARRPKLKAVLIGDPARRLKTLLDEIRLDWNDPDTGPVSEPAMCFRLACALTQVPGLDCSLNTREKIAHELNRQGWFTYNVEDTRKALGSLTRLWGLHTPTLSLLPQEAKRRGFPDLAIADELFDLIERIDTEERLYTSASGYQFDILYISETY